MIKKEETQKVHKIINKKGYGTVNNKGIRWQQRFENLLRAYNQFKNAVDAFETLTTLEKEGLIQRFEYTLELSWKTIKDYLESQEVIASFPREVIKEAFHYEIINDGEVWMDMLQSRNFMAHTYDKERVEIAINKIKNQYFMEIKQLIEFLELRK